MTKAIKGKDGKFAGSIGEGKSAVPTPASAVPVVPVVAPVSRDSARPGLVDLYQAFQNVSSTSPQYVSPPPSLVTGKALRDAEMHYASCEKDLQQTRTWAFPGVGDLEAEEALDSCYARLADARDRLHASRVQHARTPEGRVQLETRMTDHFDDAAERERLGNIEGSMVSQMRARELRAALDEADRDMSVSAETAALLSSKAAI